jgi:hypothetical protein
VGIGVTDQEVEEESVEKLRQVDGRRRDVLTDKGGAGCDARPSFRLVLEVGKDPKRLTEVLLVDPHHLVVVQPGDARDTAPAHSPPISLRTENGFSAETWKKRAIERRNSPSGSKPAKNGRHSSSPKGSSRRGRLRDRASPSRSTHPGVYRKARRACSWRSRVPTMSLWR